MLKHTKQMVATHPLPDESPGRCSNLVLAYSSMFEHRPHKPRDLGAIPGRPTIDFSGRGRAARHLLWEQDYVGANPTVLTIYCRVM